MEYCILDNSNEIDFKDLALQITKFKKKFLGDYYLECYGTHLDKKVGMGIYIKSNMQGVFKEDANSFKFYKNGIKIVSIGSCSDDFLTAVTEIYGFEKKQMKLKREVLIDCVTLQGNLKERYKAIVRFKCFFDANNDKNNYAEVFINFDFNNFKVYINEKDSEYREKIISNLSE